MLSVLPVTNSSVIIVIMLVGFESDYSCAYNLQLLCVYYSQISSSMSRKSLQRFLKMAALNWRKYF